MSSLQAAAQLAGTIPLAIITATALVVITVVVLWVHANRRAAVLVEFSELANVKGSGTVCVDCTHPFLPNLTHHKV